MNTEKPPVGVYHNISHTQFSIARYSGGARINGHEYIYNPKDDTLALMKRKRK